jgi:oligopeptide/dipeptide ABC transporter ATP-binding protein
LSVLGLLAHGVARVTRGTILFDGRDITHADARTLDRHRGRDIGMIFQEPLSALNPVLRIGDQITEGLLIRGEASAKAARQRAIAALTDVRISDPERRLSQYPHELSGGMRQRVMIALALISSPRLLIADEPTTALDVTIQAQVLDVLKALQRERGLGMIIITHDLGVVADMADRIAVMYAGEIVEQGTVDEILTTPRHPYTIGLLSCVPELSPDARRLVVVPGNIPSLGEPIEGCRFKDRCPQYRPRSCDVKIRLEASGPGRACRCIRPVGLQRAAGVACSA